MHLLTMFKPQVHHIQSGQVIGDGLTSVVKELVENSFDASATSIGRLNLSVYKTRVTQLQQSIYLTSY